MKTDNWFIKLIKWFAGFLQDQKGAASRKAIVLYVCLYYFYILIDGSLNGKLINETLLLYLTAIILFCIGAITAEFFNKLPTSSKSTTTTKETSVEIDKKENNSENKE